MVMAAALRVLLVEDSKVLTERLTEAIRQIPEVELIGTADTEAAALAAVKRDSVDVIILDLHLKQGTGFGVMLALATTQQKPRLRWAPRISWTRPATTGAFRKCFTKFVKRTSRSIDRSTGRRSPISP